MNWIKKQWAALPHQVQAAIVSVSGAFLATFVNLASQSGCYSATCLKQYVGTAVTTALVALRAFYMIPAQPK